MPRGLIRFEHTGNFHFLTFYDFLVHNEKKRVEKLRYMHRNPVVRGLVQNLKTGHGLVSGNSEVTSLTRLDSGGRMAIVPVVLRGRCR